MSHDATDPLTMADLEQADPTLAAQVRRARRKEDAERIRALAGKAREASAPQEAKKPTPRSTAPQAPTEPEPNWR